MEQKQSWMNPVGIWEVSTEADCEGRSTRRIGIFKGHYADIALALADQCCYTLWFRRIDESKMVLPKIQTRDEVDIAFDDSIGIESSTMRIALSPILEKDNIVVRCGHYNGHINVSRAETEEMKRTKAMEKLKGVLTPEEMQMLGL